MRMRRATISLVLAGAIALAIPPAMHGQRGGGGHGMGGGHAGGFSGGGFGARGFGGGGFGGSFSRSFSAPTARSFPAPPMNFMSRPGYGPSARSFGTYPQRGWAVTRSPFGQLSAPGVNRGSYPGIANNRTPAGQWSRGGYPNRRYPYRRTISIYSSSFYAGPGWFGPWPYFGNWGDFGFDDSYSQASAAPDQYYAPDQGYAPEQNYAPSYEQAAPPPYQTGVASAAPVQEPVLTIIYRDGHSQQVRNYALTSTSLLVLDNAASGRTEQVSLDEINLTATQDFNRLTGLNFTPPLKN
jgi:hypothetical protein